MANSTRGNVSCDSFRFSYTIDGQETRFSNIVLHIPHASIEGLANGDYGRWNDIARFIDEMRDWTDWYTDLLFVPSKLNSNIKVVRFDKSRFVLDVERLRNDPLESIGQGMMYTSFNGFTRHLDDEQRDTLMRMYNAHIDRFYPIINENTLLIDCHSFPSRLSDNDICIGYNDDWSRPSETVIDKIVTTFTRNGYKVGINNPYSNSLTPISSVRYKSIMIEINKRLYMNEKTIRLSPQWNDIKQIIDNLYKIILRCAQ